MTTSQTHLTLNQAAFDPTSIPEETHAFNRKLMSIGSTGPKWYEVGASTYRNLRAQGKTSLPAATLLPNAIVKQIPSRDPNRTIPIRILSPTNTSTTTPTPRNIFMHIHGGGWVLQSESSQDPVLQHIANSTDTLVISIGYRLAPESPFPAGPEDCYDAAEYLIRSSSSTTEFNGATLSFIGGESAGGHLSMLTALHLLQHGDPTYSNFKLKGLVLHYGMYDATFTPHVYNFKKEPCLVLDQEIMEHYREAFLPGMTMERMKQADVSPLFADLGKLRGRLPPALFTCGTEDPLLDETVFMSAKWMMGGAEAIVKIVPGGCHGYTYFIDTPASGCAQGMDATADFMKSRLD